MIPTKTESLAEEYQKAPVIDTVHGDEALKVIAAAGGDDYWDGQEEKSRVRKIDRRLLPVLCIVYGVQFYDKVMFAQAVRRLVYIPRNVTRAVCVADHAHLGSVRPGGRSGTLDREPLCFLVFHLLPWFHCWCLSCYLPSPTLTN